MFTCLVTQVGGEQLYLLHKSLKTLGQETRNLEIDLNETLNQASTCRQALKHLEPDVQAVQGRKDLEAKIAEYTQCKHFRVGSRLSFQLFIPACPYSIFQSLGLRREGRRAREGDQIVRTRENQSERSQPSTETLARSNQKMEGRTGEGAGCL